MIHEAWYSLGLAERPKPTVIYKGESIVTKQSLKHYPNELKEAEDPKNQYHEKDYSFEISAWIGRFMIFFISVLIVGIVLYKVFS